MSKPAEQGKDEPQEGKPSGAYYVAKNDTLIYNLSELAFGSLLASYTLGFMGFTLSKTGGIPLAPRTLIWTAVYCSTYLSVSMSFAYLTASLYVSYHSVILAKPSLSLPNMRWDFMVSLAQAVFFGLSMLFPSQFPIWLASVLVIGFVRQKYEYQVFRDSVIRQKIDSKEVDEIFRRGHQEQLYAQIRDKIKAKGFTFWLPPTKWRFVVPLVLIVFNVAIDFGLLKTNHVVADTNRFHNPHDLATCAITIILGAVVIVAANRVIRDAPERVTRKNLVKLDKKYDELLEAIGKITNET